jgi:hypothetical protein
LRAAIVLVLIVGARLVLPGVAFAVEAPAEGLPTDIDKKAAEKVAKEAVKKAKPSVI